MFLLSGNHPAAIKSVFIASLAKEINPRQKNPPSPRHKSHLLQCRIMYIMYIKIYFINISVIRRANYIPRHSLVLQINHPHLPTDIAAKTIDGWHKENASFRNLLHLVNPPP